MKKTSDVIVIGAGIIGASSAWQLARAGLRVTILERNAPGSQASQAALGVLTYHASHEYPSVMDELFLRSGKLYPVLINELAEISGERVEYRTGGQLLIAPAEKDIPEIEMTYKANATQGVTAERLTPEECRLLEPGVNPNIHDAVFFPDDAWVDNTALTQAIIRAAERAGAVLEKANVESIESSRGRVTSVRCNGERRAAGWIILAAGCWSGQIRGVPPLPVSPVRGQALSAGIRAVRRVVMSPRGYLVPKGEGQTMVGATVEQVGFDETNTLEGLREVTASGIEISPRIGASEFLGAWAGLRPATPDHLPCIGSFGETPNLVAATGHFRNGVLLAPITAQLVQAVVTGEPPLLDLAPFQPDRFA